MALTVTRPDPWLTSERQALRATARAFAAREVLPHLAAWEEAGEFPASLHRAAGDVGFLALGQPEEAGGAGEFIDQLVVAEELILAGVSSGVLASLFSHAIAVPALVAARREDLLERYVRPAIAGDKIGALGVSEPDAGSDVAQLRTSAKRDGDGWVLNGAKTYITSGYRADFVTVAARTSDEGHRGISLFVVERGTPGFGVSRKLEKMGWRSSDTAELYFDDVRLGPDQLVGEEGRGFHQIMSQFASERVLMAVQACAIAQRCIDLSIAWVRDRRTFGAPLSSRQLIRHRLAEMHRRTEVARTYARQVGERLQDGDPQIREVAAAKNTATEAMDYVVDAAVQLHGGMGFIRDSEVERHYRDARVFSIGGGTYEIMNEVIAKHLGLD